MDSKIRSSSSETSVTLPAVSSTSTSTIRRKPKVTYKSPSALSPPDLRIEGPINPASHPFTIKLLSSTSTSTSLSLSSHNLNSRIAHTSKLAPIPQARTAKKKKYPMGPPLPLYHPLGRLALSLPELDPATLGYTKSIPADDSSRRSSARTRRPAAKLRDADEDNAMPTIAAVATASAATTLGAGAGVATGGINVPVSASTSAKERSPRKRRANAGTGTGAKRRRREVDDGDATYPAKRTRNTRAATAVASAAAELTGERVSPGGSTAAEAEASGVSEAPQEEPRKVERRVTRARGVVTRRDSSASEATSVSVSIAASGAGASGGAGGRGKRSESASVVPVVVHDEDRSEERNGKGAVEKDGKGGIEKEEGELSEETNSTQAKE